MHCVSEDKIHIFYLLSSTPEIPRGHPRSQNQKKKIINCKKMLIKVEKIIYLFNSFICKQNRGGGGDLNDANEIRI